MSDIFDEIAGEEEPIPQEGEEILENKEPIEPIETTEPEGPEEGKEEEDDRPKMVPHAALHETRETLKQTKTELEETRSRMAKMEDLWEKLQAERAEAEAPKVPEYDEDPEGYLRGNIETLQKQLEELSGERRQEKEQTQQQQTEQQRYNEFMNQYATSVRAFTQETPDFNDAYEFLGKTIDEDLQARGFDNPQERAALIQREEGFMVGRALREGKDPASIIYNYAKNRGYDGKAEDKLETLERGAKAANSLSGKPGKMEGAVTLETLAGLDGKEFDEAWEKAKKQGLLG